MIIKKYELLNKHTTIKIGGIADTYYMPESVLELQELLKSESDFYCIGGGQIY